MNKNVSASSAFLASLVVASVASAQSANLDTSVALQPKDDDDSPNRLAISYRMGLNITASFKNKQLIPSYYSVPNTAGVLTPTLINPGPAASGQNHVYDNGYNQVDTTGNAAGYTSYWGYQNAAQVGASSVAMDSLTPTLGAGNSAGSDPESGFEISYERELGHPGHWSWGIEAAFGWMNVNVNDNASAAGNYTLTQDTYSIGPISPAPAPYNGPYSAPPGSAVISDSPQRATTLLTSTGEEDLSADVYSLRLGPYLKVPLIKHRLSATLSGGLALLYVHSDFTYQETVLEPNVGVQTYSGSGSHSDFEPGGYVEGTLSLKLTRALDVFAGVQYMKVTGYSQTEGVKEADLSFNNSFFVTAGVGYSF